MHHNNLPVHTARARELELRSLGARPERRFALEIERERRSKRRRWSR